MGTTADGFGDFKVKSAVGTAGLAQQGHTGFAGGAVPFFHVATHTGTDHIFPSILAAKRPRDHVIQGEIFAEAAAVLTTMPIPVEDVAARKRDLLVGNVDIVAQANDGGQRNVAVHHSAIVLDLLGLALEQKNDRPAPTGDVERLVGGIQNQNFAHSAAHR
jgi:hypothetical protein